MNGASQPVIRIVDDDDAVRDSLEILLESHGMAVRAYASASDFLAGIDHGESGCLVLDLHLPIVGGLDLLHILRERKLALPVIFITGGSDKKMKARAIDAGAVAFLEKPVSEEPLLAAIRYALAVGRELAGRSGADSGLKTTAGCPSSSPS